MSGGTFNYDQHRLIEIKESIQEHIEINGTKRNHPNEFEGDYHRNFPDDIIAEFKKAVKLLELAYIYTQRIDYLIAADDGEDSFRRRLKEELDEYNKTEE